MIAYGRRMRWIAILWMFALACSDAKPATFEDCKPLDRAACMKSASCTLVHAAGDSYACRPESGDCERGHVQDDAAACTRRAGCEYKPASCYCPCKGYGKTTVDDGPDTPSCKCDCAGNLPPACVEKAPR